MSSVEEHHIIAFSDRTETYQVKRIYKINGCTYNLIVGNKKPTKSPSVVIYKYRDNDFAGFENIKQRLTDPTVSGLSQRAYKYDNNTQKVVLCVGKIGRSPEIEPSEGRDLANRHGALYLELTHLSDINFLLYLITRYLIRGFNKDHDLPKEWYNFVIRGVYTDDRYSTTLLCIPRNGEHSEEMLPQFETCDREEQLYEMNTPSLLLVPVDDKFDLLLYKKHKDDGLEIIKDESKGGRAVVASRKFYAGENVCEYRGKLMSGKEGDEVEKQREFNDDLAGTKTMSYAFFFKYQEKNYCIDATYDDGSIGRLINHSKGNRNVKPKIVVLGKTPHIVFEAIRDIEPEEEILYDYGDTRKSVVEHNTFLKQ